MGSDLRNRVASEATLFQFSLRIHIELEPELRGVWFWEGIWRQMMVLALGESHPDLLVALF